MENFTDLSQTIKQEVEKANHILFHFHPSPDADSVGSVLALAEACRNLDKKVTVISGDSDLSAFLAHLPGFKLVTKANYFDLNLADFDLFLILDSASLEMISRQGEVIFPTSLTTAVIDHHESNTNYGDINLINKQAGATAEIVFYLLKDWKVEISKTMASNLYIGLHSDTGGFKYTSTSAKTLLAGSQLLEINPEASKVVLEAEQQYSKQSLVYQGLALSKIETLMSDRIGLIAVSADDLIKNEIKLEDTEGANLGSNLLSVKNFIVGVTLIEKNPNDCRISLRSKDYKLADVSGIAEKLGGGGHKQASGASLKIPFTEAKAKLIEVLNRNLRL